MARPIKQGLDYFPLDVDIDQDDKIAMIEALYGHEGFSVVIKLLAKIYKEGYFYEWNKREQILFSKRVNVNINTLSEIINDCVREGLFNKNVFNAHNALTSKGIQKRYLEAVKRRKQVIFLENYFLIDDVESIIGSNKIDVFLEKEDGSRVNVNINPHSKVVNEEFSTQRKGKERKGKEKKQEKAENENVVVNPHDFYQENFGVLNSFIADDIGAWIDDTSKELVIEAMKISLQSNKPWKYATGILKDWHKHNLKTLDDVQAYNKSYEETQKKRTGKPKSFNESPIKYAPLDLEGY